MITVKLSSQMLYQMHRQRDSNMSQCCSLCLREDARAKGRQWCRDTLQSKLLLLILRQCQQRAHARAHARACVCACVCVCVRARVWVCGVCVCVCVRV